MFLKSAGRGAGAGRTRMALDRMLHAFVHSLAQEPGLILKAEQGLREKQKHANTFSDFCLHLSHWLK